MLPTLNNFLLSLEDLYKKAFISLHKQCNNGASHDDFQHPIYELAFCVAEINAARTYVHYCYNLYPEYKNSKNLEHLEEDTYKHYPLEYMQALYFGAEVIEQVKNRLFIYQKDLEISAAYQALFSDDALIQFCQRYTHYEFIEQIYAHLAQQKPSTGTSLLDKEKTLIHSTFQKVGQEIVAPLAESIHREDLCIPDTIINALNELGCFGLSIPERYGGIQSDQQEDNLGMIVVTEALSEASLGAAGSLITRPEILARALLKGGSQAQKHYWLPRIAKAEPLVAIAVTEPDTGSDVASVKLKATRCPGGWRLNGNKTWCTMAGKSGLIFTLARTDSEITPKHKGLSCFLVEKPSFDGHNFYFEQSPENTPRLSTEQALKPTGKLSGKAIPTIGYRGMHSFDLFFEDFFVPDDHVLGESEGIGKGFYYTMAGFEGGRIQTAARAIGLMQASYHSALNYSQDRKVFGHAVADYQLSKLKLARMATLTNVCRQFTYSVARMMDEGNGSMEASLVKLFACKTAEWISREGLQLHGGMGYAEESAISRYYVDSRVLSIFEGAEETLALKVIGRHFIDTAID